MEENGIIVVRRLYGGCPQGSALGPLLWLFLADKALKHDWGPDIYSQAYADDFMYVVTAEDKDQLVDIANDLLLNFNNWLIVRGLSLNLSKIEILYLNRDTYGNLPTQMSCVLEGIKLKDENINTKETLKYLGLIIDKNLTSLSSSNKESS